MSLRNRMVCLGAIFLIGGFVAKAQEGVAPVAPVVPAATPVPVGVQAAAPADDMASWTPVSEDTLDDARGGMDVGEGLVASFGIDRAVYVNGNLVTSTSFNLPDVAHITPAQATAMATALNTVSITQIGPNNMVDPASLARVSGGTVIQNTLNGQNIQSITTLNTTVNTLNAFRQTNFQDAMQQSQLQSLGH